MNKLTYGLDNNTIADNDWFWGEVWLRSVNNYGQWEVKREAKEWILRAIKEISIDANWDQTRTFHLITESTRQIKLFVEDMTSKWNN